MTATPSSVGIIRKNRLRMYLPHAGASSAAGPSPLPREGAGRTMRSSATAASHTVSSVLFR